jgi:hypothetical protein
MKTPKTTRQQKENLKYRINKQQRDVKTYENKTEIP